MKSVASSPAVALALALTFIVASAFAGATASPAASESPVPVAAAAPGQDRQQPPDRSAAPKPGPPPALKLPAVQKRTLSNGLQVWIVELHDVPVVDVTLALKAGSGADPRNKFGIANLTAAMLDEGAGTRDALQIADGVDYLGASLSTSSTSDASFVELHVPVARLADALPIMADVALRPTFPKEELERLRQQRLVGLLQARDDPQTIASMAFSRTIFGPSHRYGTATLGTADTIKAFSPDDLRAFYLSAYRPDNAALLVVGDVTAASVLPLM
jgi:zinc protease